MSLLLLAGVALDEVRSASSVHVSLDSLTCTRACSSSISALRKEASHCRHLRGWPGSMWVLARFTNADAHEKPLFSCAGGLKSPPAAAAIW